MRKLFISFFIKFFLVQMKLVINLLLPKNFKSDNDLTIKTHLINFTKYVNRYLIEANKIASQSIYVSKWLMDLYVTQGITSKNNKVI